MDLSNVLLTFGMVAYVGIIIFAANNEAINPQAPRLSRPLLFGVLGAMLLFALLMLQAALFTNLGAPEALGSEVMPAVDPSAALINLVITGLVGLAGAWMLWSVRPRRALKRLLGSGTGFDPESPVHTAAIVLTLALLVYTLGNLIIGGGLSGLAEEMTESGGVGVGETLLNQVLWGLAALLGVGLFIRRSPAGAAARLGLRWPTLPDLILGALTGVLMYFGIIAITAVWIAAVTPEQLEQQTAVSQLLTQSFNTLPIALLVSIAVAIGEELFFRGALQPIFGLWMTTLFFAALHTQYTLTPASLGIFLVSLALGLLRRRTSTSGAIIAHFVYNFIQLALAILVSSVLGGQ